MPLTKVPNTRNTYNLTLSKAQEERVDAQRPKAVTLYNIVDPQLKVVAQDGTVTFLPVSREVARVLHLSKLVTFAA